MNWAAFYSDRCEKLLARQAELFLVCLRIMATLDQWYSGLYAFVREEKVTLTLRSFPLMCSLAHI